MRRILLLSFIALLTKPAFSQAPADTTLSLQNIDIQGSRFAGLSERNGKHLQVEKNLTSATVTTADAFRQLPSVITDIEGGVTFRGSNKPAMLINGIPYGLLEEYSGDVLIQLPALFFNQLSLSQFPSARLIPDGDAGLIDLSSTTFGRKDSPLMVTLGGGWNERYNVGAALNLHPGKFWITAKYNYRREYRARSFSKSTTTEKNRTEMDNNAAARPDVHLADLQVRYDLTPSDELTVHGLYHLMDYSRYGRINNKVFNLKGEPLKYVIRNRYNDQKQQAYAAEARWKHAFSDIQSLHTVFNYNNFSYDEDNDFKNENPDNGKIVAEDNQFINQTKHNYYWSLGYSQLLPCDWTLGAGYIGRSRSEYYNTVASNKVEGEWTWNPQKTYNYHFQRLLNLLYLNLSKDWGALNLEAGLQAEWSKQDMDEFSATWSNSTRSNFHLYPHARLEYELSKSNKLNVSYQQRVIRPNGSSLSLFQDSGDVTHILQGNPDLQAEFIHIMELGYQFTASRFRLLPAIYYRVRTNRIMEVASQVSDQTVWKKENMGHSQTIGVDLSGSWNPSKILTIGFAGDIYRDEIDGQSIGYGSKKSLVCWDVKGNVNLSITPTTDFQVDAFYVSDQLTPQGKIKSRYSVNAGISHYFLHRDLRVNLSINNLFDSLGETTIIHTDQLQITQKRNRDARVAWLTLTYNL